MEIALESILGIQQKADIDIINIRISWQYKSYEKVMINSNTPD